MRTDNFNQKKKKFKPDSRFFARVLVIIISLSMLIGTLYYALAFFSIHPHAENTDEDNGTNFYVRIQIFANENITCSVRLVSDNGFELGYTDGGRSYYKLDETIAKELCVSRHVNLKKDGTKYDRATSSSNTAVGCYHISVASDENYREDVALLGQAFPEYNVFPAYINGDFRVFIGQFSTTDAASSALNAVKEKVDSPAISDDQNASLMPEDLTEALLNASVHTPGGSSVIVIDPTNDQIVWAHDNDSGAQLFGIGARQNENGENSFFKCYHGATGKTYDGYFEFAGYSPEEHFGVRGINLVELENYIVGVCSAEIPTTWPMETIKAFSIAVRCYTIRSLGKHSGNKADLCNTADCQVFNGYGPAVDRVWKAVAETKGIIAVSNGSICGTYYSSSTGGCTANCTDVWGSSLATYPYLKAVATPWEQYRIHSRGQRTTVVTGTALYNKLEEKGYTALSGPVTDVQITKTGQNTTYVTEIKFYDAEGNCETVTRADRIQKLLNDYMYSSNFVVVKSGDTAVRTNYTLMGFGGINPEETTGLDILGNPIKYSVFGHKSFSVVTSNGTKTFYDSSTEKVITAGGIKDFNMSYALDSQVYPTIIGVNGDVLPDIPKLTGIAETESIQTDYVENSFTFIGRGWGHGVGLSQYGIYDLGNLGYDYLTILRAYYTGIEFMTYKAYLGK